MAHKQTRYGAVGEQGAPMIPAKPGCGPDVDSWPILDSDGKSIEVEEEEEE